MLRTKGSTRRIFIALGVMLLSASIVSCGSNSEEAKDTQDVTPSVVSETEDDTGATSEDDTIGGDPASEIEAETEVEPSPTNEPIIPAQNRAPSINLSSVECLEELRKDDSTIQVEIIVTDEDDSTAIIDLSAEINEESIDLSEWISNGTTLDVPGTAIAYVPMLPGTETYLLLIAHAADDDGEVSEAALVIPNNCS